MSSFMCCSKECAARCGGRPSFNACFSFCPNCLTCDFDIGEPVRGIGKRTPEFKTALKALIRLEFRVYNTLIYFEEISPRKLARFLVKLQRAKWDFYGFLHPQVADAVSKVLATCDIPPLISKRLEYKQCLSHLVEVMLTQINSYAEPYP